MRSMMQVKVYVMRQWSKILAGRVSLADFVFAKEVRNLVLFLDLLAICWRLIGLAAGFSARWVSSLGAHCSEQQAQ